ncbi:TPA: GNAT family N-acetyltransferase [Photobacterium damselae]
MNTPEFHKLETLRFPLVNKLYKDHYPAGKAKRDEIIWVGEQNGTLIAAVRFKVIEESQLLTGMVVHSQYRRKNIASQFLYLLSEQLELYPCYCFALYELEGFYQRNGFITIDSSELPHPLQQRFERYSSGKKLVPMLYKNGS